MRLPFAVVLLVLFAVPAPARGQLSNRSISLESGVAASGGAAAALAAITASHWLDADFHLTARLAWGDAPGTTGRVAASALAGTAGLAWAPGTGPLRTRLFAEAGWARIGSGAGARSGALGAGGAVEWFVGRDLALHAGIAARRAGAWRLELAAGISVLF